MSVVDFTPEMLQGMDPALIDIFQQTQNDYANAIKNPDFAEITPSIKSNSNAGIEAVGSEKNEGCYDEKQEEFDPFCPKEYRHMIYSDKQSSPVRGRNASIAYSASVSRSPVRRPKLSAEERRLEQRRWVVEIDKFADELNMRDKVPSEMEMMKMDYDDIYDLWQIYDEKYNQSKTQYVLRNAFAIGGIMLGFGIHKVARFFLHDEVMDMQVWADHWFMHVTTDRPGRTPPFDAALMILLRRLTWVRDYAAGEGSMIMGYIMFMYKEYQAQKKAKSEMLEREKAMEERIRKSVLSEFEENLKNSQWKPESPKLKTIPTPLAAEKESQSQSSDAVSSENEGVDEVLPNVTPEATRPQGTSKDILQSIAFDTASIISDDQSLATSASGVSKSIQETESVLSEFAPTTTTTSSRKKRKSRSKKQKIDIDLDDDDDEVQSADNATV